MKKIFSLQTFVSSVLLLPLSVSAQATGASVSGGFTSLAAVIDTFTETVVKSTATLFLSLALLAFFFGIVEYIWGKRQGDGGKVKVGNDFMKWGLLALFVMFSVYGIIQLAQGFIGIRGNVETIVIPKINFKGGSSSSGGTNGASNSISSPGSTGGSNGSVGGYNTAEEYCTAYGGRWVNGSCDSSVGGSATPQAYCTDQGGRWVNGACDSSVGGSATAQAYCTDQGGRWVNGACDSSVGGSATAQAYCTDQGGRWVNGACDSSVGGSATAQAYCVERGGIWNNGQCDDAQDYCNNSGGSWINGQCNAVSDSCTANGGTLRSDGSCNMSGLSDE